MGRCDLGNLPWVPHPLCTFLEKNLAYGWVKATSFSPRLVCVCVKSYLDIEAKKFIRDAILENGNPPKFFRVQLQSRWTTRLTSVSQFTSILSEKDPKFPANEDGKALSKRLQKFQRRTITQLSVTWMFCTRAQALEIINTLG